MTFGEHLEELRACLFKAVFGLVLGIFVGLFFGRQVVEVIEHPLKAALGKYYQDVAVKEYDEFFETQEALKAPLPYTREEVKDLVRKRHLIYEVRQVDAGQMAAALAAGNPKLAEQLNPPPAAGQAPKFVSIFLWHPIEDDPRINPEVFNATEGFMIWFKAAFVLGVVISSPWIFYQLWSFVAAGLYPHEKKYIHLFLPISVLLFFLGASTAYLFVFEPVLKFLFDYSGWLGFEIRPRISEWLSFVIFLPLGFGVSFQLPLVMLFLERIGIVSVRAYLERWRISVLVIVVVSAVLTPADPVSIFWMAIPLIALYFAGIVLCRLLPRGQFAVEPVE